MTIDENDKTIGSRYVGMLCKICVRFFKQCTIFGLGRVGTPMYI